ncbi:Rv3654c family TadE-like protein [Bifidobacterium felsineum]|uniref:Pilus assembly protein TadE n=1 Tax=Bifidobacterium felsineum TaxID=2045440 RepID=A0A2M9HLH5_9BIFI|nr:Rv3654c family TadE-like protein [Bifidobacterium felsineum]MBT1163189.1 flp pilus-assembly TadE/G-like family protein [Bifidobacterium felsineum]PJM77663.1 pilus assembly protein TadE [Bifidobacterium felsineum]
MKARLEEGSGTIAGAMLVMVAAAALALIASVGNLLICQHKARSIADLAAFNTAYALWHSDMEAPCVLANKVAEANNAVMVECEVIDDDVRVVMALATQVPFTPQVTKEARAGPVECD